MLSFIIFGFLILCANAASVRNDCIFPGEVNNQPNYYWRDYFGIVPTDAVKGGFDVTGNVTFVGQIGSSKHVGIFPGNLYPGKREAVACIAEKIIDGSYVKILCGNPPEKFEWVETTAENSHLLIDYHLVIGGVQSTTVTYIGRANFEGEVQIGRVHDSKNKYKGLWLHNKAGAQVHFPTFELLVVPR